MATARSSKGIYACAVMCAENIEEPCCCFSCPSLTTSAVKNKALLGWAVLFSVLCCGVSVCSLRAFEVLGHVLSDEAAAMYNM